MTTWWTSRAESIISALKSSIASTSATASRHDEPSSAGGSGATVLHEPQYVCCGDGDGETVGAADDEPAEAASTAVRSSKSRRQVSQGLP